MCVLDGVNTRSLPSSGCESFTEVRYTGFTDGDYLWRKGGRAIQQSEVRLWKTHDRPQDCRFKVETGVETLLDSKAYCCKLSTASILRC